MITEKAYAKINLTLSVGEREKTGIMRLTA